jgi:hypothetical protein
MTINQAEALAAIQKKLSDAKAKCYRLFSEMPRAEFCDFMEALDEYGDAERLKAYFIAKPIEGCK